MYVYMLHCILYMCIYIYIYVHMYTAPYNNHCILYIYIHIHTYICILLHLRDLDEGAPEVPRAVQVEEPHQLAGGGHLHLIIITSSSSSSSSGSGILIITYYDYATMARVASILSSASARRYCRT